MSIKRCSGRGLPCLSLLVSNIASEAVDFCCRGFSFLWIATAIPCCNVYYFAEIILLKQLFYITADVWTSKIKQNQDSGSSEMSGFDGAHDFLVRSTVTMALSPIISHI